MNEVFETPEDVGFQPYAAVHPGHAIAPEDTHFERANLELDESDVAPTKAFEVFMGKVYKPVTKQTEFEASAASTATKTAQPSVKGELESPLQRYTRLAMELKELDSDLALLAANSQAKKDSMLVDAAQEAEFSEIMQGLATLQLNLSAIEQNASYQPFLRPNGATPLQTDAVATLQRDLTAKFFQQIEGLKRQQQGHSSVPSSSSSAPIVYEIYSNGELNAVDRDAKTRMVALESRIASLEKVIGATNSKELHVDGLRGESAGTDLSTIVDTLEKRVNLLNEKNLDAIKTRTTALVHEFTLLHKLKESPSVQGALNSQADREKIQQIYSKMTSIEDVAASVPSLVDRLVTLKTVHDGSLDMSARVKKMEQSQEVLTELLTSDAAVLANVRIKMMVSYYLMIS
ncbi:hypothetical protein Poli38472_009410 [Pythium oligandrum]|uniref:Dynactin subunit 2 n=1 Tax=Pythium oligandrum TaxID=41045 RepID=A0A8K1CMX7_PYTOL|nr:hypothetical protein Poli38472_009410 [Pythium oligandrum]|eukprot:TMW65243.1 hypothetical protein Poli38472_009410 [Pythium oligandrum]